MKSVLKIKYSDRLLTVITSCISLIAFFYFYFHGQQNLSYYDAIARLNTARKMIDSITPGIGQLGGIWLPFPQMLSIPFIWNDFLWHTGIAGYIISGISFVVGAMYLEKAVYLLIRSRKVSLLIWFIFVSNENILLLQTMAMSEVFFLCFFILSLYFLIAWMQEHKLNDLLLIAFCLMVLTLTRYEGYFVFMGVFTAVVIECIRTYTWKKKEKIEGLLLLFLTVAGFGIFLWCIYSALFYKDPLFWLHAYTPPPASVLSHGNPILDQEVGIKYPNLLQSLEIYTSVMFWTNGAITTILGFLGLVMYCFRPVKGFFYLWLVSVILFVFLIIGYFKGFIPHIEFPPLFLTGNGVRVWSAYADNNVRYGIVILPSVLFFAALAAAKNKFFFVVVALFAFEQLCFSIISPQLLQYRFDQSWRYPHIIEVPWFKAHYDGGLVLIAASRHEDFMFQSGLPYKDFIYEGTRQYWNDSLNNPSLYARWVVYDVTLPDDDVTNDLTKKGVIDLNRNFQLVYLYKGFHIYKLKDQAKTQ